MVTSVVAGADNSGSRRGFGTGRAVLCCGHFRVKLVADLPFAPVSAEA